MSTGAKRLTTARRLVFVIAAWQLALGVVAAAGLWIWLSATVGHSAFLGGAIAAVSSVCMAIMLPATPTNRSARSLLNRFILGEVVKLAVTAALFAAVILLIPVAPIALLGTFVAGFIVYWLVLINVTSKMVP